MNYKCQNQKAKDYSAQVLKIVPSAQKYETISNKTNNPYKIKSIIHSLKNLIYFNNYDFLLFLKQTKKTKILRYLDI